MVSLFSEWSSYWSFISSLYLPPDPTISLWISALSYLYGSIVTRAFDLSQPVTMFIKNCNLVLFQSDSYITHVLTSSISGWSVKGTPFLGLWRKVFFALILKYIFDQTSPLPNVVAKRLNLDHMGDFTPTPSCGNNFIWFWESYISTENSGEGSRSNVYSLGAIRSSAGLTKWLLFFPLCVEVLTNWWASKRKKCAYCLVLIANNVLGSPQWHMKRSACLHSSLSRFA